MELVRNIMEGNEELSEDEAMGPIHLGKVSSDILEKVVEFCESLLMHPIPSIEKPLRSSNLHDILPKVHADFFDVDREMLFHLLNAADYLNIEDLLTLCGAKIATLIMGRSTEQLREDFGIENDYSPEEYDYVLRQNEAIKEAIRQGH